MPVVHVSAESFQAELDDLAKRIADCFYEQWRTFREHGKGPDPIPGRGPLEQTLEVLLNMGVIEIGPGLATQEAVRGRSRAASA